MIRRKQRLLKSCGILLGFLTIAYLATALFSPSSPDDIRPGGRRLQQLTPIQVDPVPGQLNCTPPAIGHFPRPLFNQQQRRHGAVVLYVLAAFYCFLGLAIVCDDYFVPSLEVIANVFHLSEDVAGATFLAAGSSAPELATTTLAVFVTKDDIGISGVIGSAVFNAMLVIALVALLVDKTIQIRRYPMLRDSACYMVSIAALLVVIADNRIFWYEAFSLMLLYLLYCLVMWKNRSIDAWLTERCSGRPVRVRTPGPQPEKQALVTAQYPPDGYVDIDASTSGDVREVPYLEIDPFAFPEGVWNKALHVVSLPIIFCCFLSMPDVRRSRWRFCFPLTFLVAISWIALYSYIMVWMITVIGFTLNIPDTIMGLSFVGIGVSMPDVLASVAVARDGYGDMAVSNALGSNVFDILFCMGVPWFFYTTLADPGGSVRVDSGGVMYSTVFLFSTVVFLLVATCVSRWRLTKPYGVSLLVWYAIFLAVACMYEMNVFGQLTLPMCPSPL